MRVRLYVALLPLLAGAALHAQEISADSGAPPSHSRALALVQPSLRERVAPHIGSDSITLAPADAPSGGEVVGRMGAAAIGASLGGLGAGLLGYAVLPHSDCDCDDPGLNEFLIGAAVGTVAGAALAAALPKQRSRCSYGKRVVYGLAGALAGGALGMIPHGDARVLFVPVGASIGAGVASAYC
ncbi:MAG TPA: hypothetical protein VFK39_10285 [Gemmatimonadaceae bacterium]|nr:hypothetical protein [Gemmatimonadaceae bacterium]